MPVKILTSQGCACGANLSIIGDTTKLRGVCGEYTVDGGRTTIYAKVECLSGKCGLVYEADHPRFAGSFNELAEKLMR